MLPDLLYKVFCPDSIAKHYWFAMVYFESISICITGYYSPYLF